MSAQVDVLAVMDAEIEALREEGGAGVAVYALSEARSDVAELIEAANAIAAHQDAATSSEWDRMNAALARVSGGAA